jgi:phosphomannomutase
MKSFHGKELIVFDLDGTLTETKSNLKADMSRALTALLKKKKVAVIGGGTYGQFKKQFLNQLRCPKALLPDLSLFPTTATSFYRYKNSWEKIYGFELSKRERAQIKQAFSDVFKKIHYVQPKKVYGKVIEDRRTQITFSALGQDVVAQLGEKGVRLKEKWTRENVPLKFRIAKLLAKRLPKLEVHASGFTSIDVTRRGIDKEYGVRQMQKYLHVPIKKMLFIGDALFPGGNDYAARRTGMDCIAVRGPEDTKRIIKKILKSD